MNPLTDLRVRKHAYLLPYHTPFEDSEEDLSFPLSQRGVLSILGLGAAQL